MCLAATTRQVVCPHSQTDSQVVCPHSQTDSQVGAWHCRRSRRHPRPIPIVLNQRPDTAPYPCTAVVCWRHQPRKTLQETKDPGCPNYCVRAQHQHMALCANSSRCEARNRLPWQVLCFPGEPKSMRHPKLRDQTLRHECLVDTSCAFTHQTITMTPLRASNGH